MQDRIFQAKGQPNGRTLTRPRSCAAPADQLLGTLPELLAIAVLVLLENGELDDKVIAMPVDPALRLFDVDGSVDLRERCPQVLELMEEWFTYLDTVRPA